MKGWTSSLPSRSRRERCRLSCSPSPPGDRRATRCAGTTSDRISVRGDHPLPLQADGEDLGDVTEAVFEAERESVTVLA